jgi:NADH-quinone oxidoreductase subunit N
LVLLAALGCLLEGVLPVRRGWLAPAAALLLVAALAVELVLGGQSTSLFGGGYSQDRFALFAKAALLLAVLLVVLASDWAETGGSGLGLTLVACLGGMVAASAGDLAGLWAGLQLAVLASLALVGLRDPLAARRMLPAMAALGALVAIGMALVAGDAGSSVLVSLRANLGQPLALPLAIALLLVVGTLLGQLAAAPWLGPLAAGAAGIVLLKFAGSVAALGSAWAVLLPATAAVAMLVAALGAVAGGPARGILGWAGLLQLGWVVAGLAGGSRLAFGASLFLFGAYLVASAAAPLALGATPHGLAGLAERGVARAAGFAVCLLSLAGVPPLPGFFGEFAVAAQLVRGGLFWLVALGFFSTSVVAFAVLRDLRLVFLASAGEAVAPVARGRLIAAGATASALVVIAYSLFANPISGLAVQGAAAVGLR